MRLLAPQDRPREKMARAGVAALGDNELVALLIGTGTSGRDALTVAGDVLELAGGLSGLRQLALDDLLRVSGIGPPRAARLLAAVELGRRAMTHWREDRPQFATTKELGRYLLALYGGHREERFGVVLMDAKYRLIRAEVLSIGTLDASIAHPREIFRAAAIASAYCLALFHNHPSGDPAPSREDADLTRRMRAAGEVMGIPVVDHVILGAGRWFSFRDSGVLT